MEQEAVIEFMPRDAETASVIKTTFKDEELLQSNAFGGALVLTIIAAATPVIKMAFRFYKEHRTSLRDAKVRIGEKEISFEGFSADEINEMVDKGTIQKLQDKLK